MSFIHFQVQAVEFESTHNEGLSFAPLPFGIRLRTRTGIRTQKTLFLKQVCIPFHHTGVHPEGFEPSKPASLAQCVFLSATGA